MYFYKKFNFWQKWLTNVNILSVLLGLIVAFWSDSFIFDVYNNYTKEAFLFTNDAIRLFNSAVFVLVLINLGYNFTV